MAVLDADAGSAATSVEEHDNALKYDYPMLSEPMTSTEFIDAVE